MKAWLASATMATLASGALADAPPSKPPVGIPASAHYFHGKWYHVYLEKGPWKAARDKCVRLGGQLAIIRDERTQQFIKEIAQDLQLWIGATDEKVEGLWMWVDGTQMGYKVWGHGQPDNANGREHYLHLLPDGSWNDFPSNSLLVGFICEWKAR